MPRSNFDVSRAAERTAPEDYIAALNLHVVGAAEVLKCVEPALKKSGAGSVVLFSSVAVQQGARATASNARP